MNASQCTTLFPMGKLFTSVSSRSLFLSEKVQVNSEHHHKLNNGNSNRGFKTHLHLEPLIYSLFVVCFCLFSFSSINGYLVFTSSLCSMAPAPPSGPSLLSSSTITTINSKGCITMVLDPKYIFLLFSHTN